MRINFVVNDPSAYESVIQEMIQSVRLYLPDSVISDAAVEDEVNVHFFVPGDWNYRDRACFENGVKVFLPHGISDKGYRTGETLKDFDFICVSGPLWVEKLTGEGIPKEKLFIGGYPKLDEVFAGRNAQKRLTERKRVVYAPTHTNSWACSYDRLTGDLIKLPDGFEVITSLHPYNSCNHQSSSEHLIHADVVITDTGSLIWEAWALNIPVVFPDWLIKDSLISAWPTTLTSYVYREGIGYHAESLETLLEQVCIAAEQGITDREQRLIERVFPRELRGISGRFTAEHLMRIADRAEGITP